MIICSSKTENLGSIFLFVIQCGIKCYPPPNKQWYPATLAVNHYALICGTPVHSRSHHVLEKMTEKNVPSIV